MRARPFRRPAKRKISRGPVSQLPPASRPVRLLHPCSGLAEMPCPRARCGYGLARHSWRCDAPNDKTTRRRCWSRHLGLHHCHRSMLRLPRGSPSHATSQGRSSTWTSPSFRGCSRPLPSRSIAANKALPRTKPLRLRRPGRHHWANLRRSAIRPEGLKSFRKEQQISFGHRSGRGSSRRPLRARFEYPSPW